MQKALYGKLECIGPRCIEMHRRIEIESNRALPESNREPGEDAHP